MALGVRLTRRVPALPCPWDRPQTWAPTTPFCQHCMMLRRVRWVTSIACAATLGPLASAPLGCTDADWACTTRQSCVLARRLDGGPSHQPRRGGTAPGDNGLDRLRRVVPDTRHRWDMITNPSGASRLDLLQTGRLELLQACLRWRSAVTRPWEASRRSFPGSIMASTCSLPTKRSWSAPGGGSDSSSTRRSFPRHEGGLAGVTCPVSLSCGRDVQRCGPACPWTHKICLFTHSQDPNRQGELQDDEYVGSVIGDEEVVFLAVRRVDSENEFEGLPTLVSFENRWPSEP